MSAAGSSRADTAGRLRLFQCTFDCTRHEKCPFGHIGIPTFQDFFKAVDGFVNGNAFTRDVRELLRDEVRQEKEELEGFQIQRS